MSYDIVTDVDVVKKKLEAAINVMSAAKLFIPSDKAPMLLKSLDLTLALMQTREFQELAAFGIDLTDIIVKHFAAKVKEHNATE